MGSSPSSALETRWKRWASFSERLTQTSELQAQIRKFERLRHITGTTDEDCRRLLIEIGARRVLMPGEVEGWALIDRYDFSRPAEVSADLADR